MRDGDVLMPSDYMARALFHAARGRGRTSPNPMVGAVVVSADGIVLTKLDGTAKGGVAVGIANDLKLPIRYVGVGEGIDDLVPFSAQEYVDGLFEEKW